MTQEKTTVVEHRVFQGDYRLLRLAAPAIGPLVKPGQFVHLRVPRLEDAVLRRPFSVFKADADSLSILYKTVGRGTAALTDVKAGEDVNLIGPLGNGFPQLSESVPVLVAGGYGNAALYLQAAALSKKGVAFFGGRTAADILCVDEFEALGWDVRVTTEDGSLGTKGLVTDALDPWVEEQLVLRSLGGGGAGRGERGALRQGSGQAGDVEIFACGPNGMLRAVGERAVEKGITAWLSLDRNMACGVGACLTCVIKLKTADGWEWKRCCKDGPVFNANEIIWDE